MIPKAQLHQRPHFEQMLPAIGEQRAALHQHPCGELREVAEQRHEFSGVGRIGENQVNRVVGYNVALFAKVAGDDLGIGPRACARQRFGLFDPNAPQLGVGLMNLAGPVHVLDQRAEALGLSRGGLTHVFDLVERAPGDADEGGYLVARFAVVESFHNGSRPVLTTIEDRQLTCARRSLFERFDGAADGVDFGRQEVLAMGVFG